MPAATVKKPAVALVLSRDQGRCAVCGKPVSGQRGWDWSIHHRTPRGSGGSKAPWINLPGNLLLLDGSGTTGCHGWAEKNRKHAEERGFIVRRGIMLPSKIPVAHAVHGLITLNDDGTYQPVPSDD